ncbi:MAG: sulfite exporter TauE/SafE family protein [Smithella sp.]
MEYILICLTAFLISSLTLFSGFGLGTVLMPVFAIFFPVQVAIAATAVVHLANNLFKVFLVGRKADWGVVALFAIPGIVAAFLGASLLSFISDLKPLYTYNFKGQMRNITVVKLVIGLLIAGFSLFELLPSLSKLSFSRKYLPIGGFLSGFFGGLSGNQGALRSAFLLKAGLQKEAFIGTGTVSAVIVDIARLLVYGFSFYTSKFAVLSNIWSVVAAATMAAFIGAFTGSRLINKVTLGSIQILVGILMIIIGSGIVSGLL